VPVTAGPDIGRHNNSRLEIVGFNQRLNKTSANPTLRHSFNGTEIDLNFTSSTTVSGHPSSFGMSSAEGSSPPSHTPRASSGHHRSGSGGTWGSISRTSQLSSSPYPAAPNPSGEVWSTSELAVGSSRLNEKAWA